MSVDESALIALGRELADDSLVTDREVCAAHARDESEAIGVVPDAVIRPRDAAEIAATLRIASERGVPVTPRAAGTGRTGGAVPMRGGWVLSLQARGLAQIEEIHRADGVAVVGPGVITGALHEAVEAEGLFWGPDPNSLAQCTIGGNIAENAGGPRTMKYGATRDWVLGMEVVTGEGRALALGRRTRKGVTGLDLTSLMVGSEGTLGVITRATLRLVAAPSAVATLMAFVEREEALGSVVTELAHRAQPRCMELFDLETLSLVRDASSLPVPKSATAMLLIELDGDEVEVEHRVEIAGEILSAASPFDVMVAKHGGDRERLWAARRDMSRALRRTATNKLSEDVVVPRGSLGALLVRRRRIAEESGVRMPAYGHAGDGNLHVNFLWDDDSQRPAVDRAIRALFEEVVALGGTLSGEHGIGALKAPYLGIEQSEALIEAQRAIKAVFDPAGILNPGKIFPARASHA